MSRRPLGFAGVRASSESVEEDLWALSMKPSCDDRAGSKTTQAKEEEAVVVGFAAIRARGETIDGDLARLGRPAPKRATPPPASKPATAPTGTTSSPERGGPSYGWLVPAGVVVASIYAILIAGLWNHRQQVAPDPSASSAAADMPAAASDLPPIMEEAPPAVLHQQLTANQIAYCLSEKVRLQAAKSMVNHYIDAEIVAYNGWVSDFNSRCSDFSYYPDARAAAETYVAQHRAQLRREGAARLAALPAGSVAPVAPGQPASEPGPWAPYSADVAPPAEAPAAPSNPDAAPPG